MIVEDNKKNDSRENKMFSYNHKHPTKYRVELIFLYLKRFSFTECYINMSQFKKRRKDVWRTSRSLYSSFFNGESYFEG
jgi:hypothetical protein